MKPTTRRTLSGKRIPADTPKPATWHDLIAAAKERKAQVAK